MCVSFVRGILCAIEVVAVKGLVKEGERGMRFGVGLTSEMMNLAVGVRSYL